MHSDDDAYGHLILSYSLGEKCIEVVERDDGLIDPSGTLPKGYFSKYPQWPRHEKKALKHVKGKVLDIGIGAGRHSIYLQKKGYDATGIDSSPLAIEVSRKRGLKKAKTLSIEDIGRFKPKTFGTILMLGNNFGLFGSISKANRLLKTMHRITSAEAVIIAETTDPYKTKNPDHLRYQQMNKSLGRIPGQIRIRIRHKTHIGGWFDYLFLSKNELKNLLTETGWKIEKTIDSDGPQYIAILKKRK
jgi:SAM-dependent methyltransferase